MSRGGYNSNGDAPDPFSQVYTRVCDLLENDVELARYVKLRNIIRHDMKDPDPARENVQDADMPEIRVTAGFIQGPINQTCSTVIALQEIIIEVATGDNRLTNKLYPVKWRLFRALLDLQARLGIPYVQRVDISAPTATSDTNALLNRGTEGYSTIYAIQVHHSHNRNELP